MAYLTITIGQSNAALMEGFFIYYLVSTLIIPDQVTRSDGIFNWREEMPLRNLDNHIRLKIIHHPKIEIYILGSWWFWDMIMIYVLTAKAF